ncbi:MAG TPA: hypothetical protein VGL23_07140 [Chloroflexota bacterium]|jgi:hypothetical protein
MEAEARVDALALLGGLQDADRDALGAGVEEGAGVDRLPPGPAAVGLIDGDAPVVEPAEYDRSAPADPHTPASRPMIEPAPVLALLPG